MMSVLSELRTDESDPCCCLWCSFRLVPLLDEYGRIGESVVLVTFSIILLAVASSFPISALFEGCGAPRCLRHPGSSRRSFLSHNATAQDCKPCPVNRLLWLQVGRTVRVLGRPGVITSGLLYASVRPPHLGDILVLSLQPERDFSRGLICPDGTAGDQRSARDVALLQADYSHNHRLR